MNRRTCYFGGIDNARLDHLLEFIADGIVTEALFHPLHFLDDNGTFNAGILCDNAQRFFQGALDNGHPRVFITLELFFEFVQRIGNVQVSYPAAGHDPLFHGRPGRGKRVFDAQLLLLQLSFGCGTDLDDGYAAGELCQPLLQFFPIEIRGSILDLDANLTNPLFDQLRVAGTVNDNGLFLADTDLAGPAEHIDINIFEVDPDILGDYLSACKDSDIFEHRFAAIAETGGLDGNTGKGAA